MVYETHWQNIADQEIMENAVHERLCKTTPKLD